jgi:hypothetical protein
MEAQFFENSKIKLSHESGFLFLLKASEHYGSD